MDLEQIQVGQRIRVNAPGLGDQGQVGTIKKVQGNRCYVHLDWDERPQQVVWFYAAALVPYEPLRLSDVIADGETERRAPAAT